MVTKGTRWSSTDGKEFTVFQIAEQDGHTWIHYRNEAGTEYSCYQEAFIARFRQMPE